MILPALLFGLLVACLVGSLAFYFLPGSSRARERLQVQPRTDLVRLRKEEYFFPGDLVKKAEEKLGLQKDSPRLLDLQKTMARAGFHTHSAVSIFMGLKLGLALGLPVLALPFWSLLPLPWGLKFGLIYFLFTMGYFLPSFILSRLVQRRQKRIREALPDALDLMVVCVEAGQGLDAAVKRVAEEMRESSPDLSKELLLVNLEINAGQEREVALRNLGERSGVEEVLSLCNILVQSDRLGTSIAQTLKVQSDTLRTTRCLKLEELAAKTPVKLVFPLILFIFPAIIVVILGPAVIRITENLFK